jgi:hypothetical protein
MPQRENVGTLVKALISSYVNTFVLYSATKVVRLFIFQHTLLVVVLKFFQFRSDQIHQFLDRGRGKIKR